MKVSTRQKRYYKRVTTGHPKTCANCKGRTRKGWIRAKDAPRTGPPFYCRPCWETGAPALEEEAA